MTLQFAKDPNGVYPNTYVATGASGKVYKVWRIPTSRHWHLMVDDFESPSSPWYNRGFDRATGHAQEVEDAS